MRTEQIKKYVKWTALGLCALLLCINLITLILDAGDDRERFNWLPYSLLSVESGSMEPEISRGDMLVIKKIPFEELSVGDDVTFMASDGLVTHRLVEYVSGKYITQGIANTVSDYLPLGPESYCGKVMAVLPKLGWLTQLTPVTLVLIAALTLFLFFGQPLLKRLLYSHKNSPTKMDYALRGTASAALISLFLVMPSMTQAKYVTELNRYEVAVAQPMYFSSNYMSEGEGNSYSIQGWPGKEYIIGLDIKNYDNSLLFNHEGIDLVYAIGIELDERSSDAYDVKLSVSDESRVDTEGEEETEEPVTVENFPFPAEWVDSNNEPLYNEVYVDTIPGNDGAGQRRNYNIVITKKDSRDTVGEIVKFTVHACTSMNESYYKEIRGTFQLRVAEANQFLGQKEVTGNSSMATITQITNLVNDGDGEKLVLFKWDPDDFYLNEYERTAFNATTGANKPNYDKAAGELYMRLQAYSKVKLEFFKKHPDADEDSITVEVVEENNGDSQGTDNGAP